jgi:hypothetical protein
LIALEVLHERVPLPHRPEPDAVAEVVHLVEVLAPLRVDHLKDDLPLHLPHEVLTDPRLDLDVADVCIGRQFADEVVGG